MKRVLSLIVNPAHGHASDALRAAMERVGTLLAKEGHILDWKTLSTGEAVETIFETSEENLDHVRAHLPPLLHDLPVDRALLPPDQRRKALFLADMDSTMIMIECIDELADYAGVKDQVAKVTEAAMRGELDFAASLRARVALLSGLNADVLEACYTERVRITPGAETLVKTMTAHGTHTVLVSGGFTFFTGRIAARLGFDEHIANRLDIRDGRFTGEVLPPISDANTKLATLEDRRSKMQLTKHQTLAVGDGANDVPMIHAAGLGIAFRAKEKAVQAADVALSHTDLGAVLFLQGYSRPEFAA